MRSSMKTMLVSLTLPICLVAAFNACAFTSDKKYTDQIVAEAEYRIRQTDDAQSRRIVELENRVNELSRELAALENWTKEKWGVSVDELKRVDGKSSVSIWLLLLIVFVIVAILAFAFWPRGRYKPGLSSDSNLRPKCPRCGWEHELGDTICKNPACKTHF